MLVLGEASYLSKKLYNLNPTILSCCEEPQTNHKEREKGEKSAWLVPSYLTHPRPSIRHEWNLSKEAFLDISPRTPPVGKNPGIRLAAFRWTAAPDSPNPSNQMSLRQQRADLTALTLSDICLNTQNFKHNWYINEPERCSLYFGP